jgi:hypothetical protein
LILKYDQPLSNVAFGYNLRHYDEEEEEEGEEDEEEGEDEGGWSVSGRTGGLSTGGRDRWGLGWCRFNSGSPRVLTPGLTPGTPRFQQLTLRLLQGTLGDSQGLAGAFRNFPKLSALETEM